MKNVLIMLVGLLGALSSSLAFADTLNCNDLYVSHVYNIGARDDNFMLQNMMVVRLEDGLGNLAQCGGKDYFHLEIGSPAYAGMLSTALTAQTTGHPVQLGINTNTGSGTALSHQLAFILILKS